MDRPHGEPDATDGRRYDPRFVRALFDEMSRSYERVNVLTSFGFSRRWRRQAVERLEATRGDEILDAMTGMGEGWRYVLPAVGRTGRIVAVDLSTGMLRGARREVRRLEATNVEVIEGDALDSGLPDASVDRVICLFGIKTLSPDQQLRFAAEIRRVLRPAGSYSLIEVSVPPRRLLRAAYLFYLVRVIPLLGRLLLGNPDNYRMLGWYTERFGDVRAVKPLFEAAGLDATVVSYFFGCATGLVGRPRPGGPRPGSPSP
jgi:demethylmenaquinone methyltransferase/2-methoxy-6-polyprenyl-1,4-benzoquinol methylase